jgi:hypothetical protein
MSSCERRHHGNACPRLVAFEHEQQWRLCRCLVKVRRDLACAPARGHDRERSATEVSSRSGMHGTAVRHRDAKAGLRCRCVAMPAAAVKGSTLASVKQGEAAKVQGCVRAGRCPGREGGEACWMLSCGCMRV